jgi:type I restriction enzyme M protein
LIDEKGFFIYPSELFCNIRKRADKDENLNETLESIFNHIEDSAKGSDSEADFAGLFDDFDVNSNKLGATVAKRNEKLVKLLNGVGEMKLGDYKQNTIDAFGDAYEYLMTMYASNAGKSGGEFYTPQEVSELLTRLAIVGKTEINKVYDPACGSGSLLLKAAKILGLDYCGVDLLDDKNGNPILCEVNSNAFLQEIERITGKNIAGIYAKHIVESLK